MHGVRRGSRPKGAAAREQENIAREQASLTRRALTLRASGDYSSSAMETIARALTGNPDEYSLWAHRREALLQSLVGLPLEQLPIRSQFGHDSGIVAETRDGNGWKDGGQINEPSTKSICGDSVDSDVQRKFTSLWSAELELGLVALRRHPKAYAAWHHRLWLLSSPQVAAVLPKATMESAFHAEFTMASALLAKDGRNFHGWAHRMRTRQAAVAGGAANLKSPEEELGFVTEKINDDFANYSAWHHRSALLAALRDDNCLVGIRKDFISEELEFVRQAFYTDPDVQSAWFYHRWLLAGAPGRDMKAAVDDSVCMQELDACCELLEVEPDARWALHAQAHLLVRLGRQQDAAPIFTRLVALDPMRKGYYTAQLAKLSSP